MQVSKHLARLFIAALLAVQIFRPIPVLAQTPSTTGTVDCTATPNDPACTANVGGVNITPTDIAAAINSPTPNLANTTAYVFYTITVLLTGTFNPEITAAQAPTGPIPSTNDPADERGPNNPRPGALLPSSVNQAVHQGGLIGGLAYLTSNMVGNPPASAGMYVADLVQESRFVPDTAFAQAPGLGFGALNPILGIWKAFRNVAYYLLILIGLVVGFLVLIRHKVSGNVAVTVQNALPRIVITLILITFSYAIAGLMVDALFLSIYFIIQIFASNIFLDNARFLNENVAGITNSGGQSITDLAFNTHIFEFTINYIFSGQAWNAAESIGNIIFNALMQSVGILNFIGQVDGMLGSPIQWIVQQLFSLIFAIAIFIAMFRTFFALVMSYGGFVINVVMAPFILLPGAMPGKNPFGNWIKNLVAGLAPFAVAIFMIFMSLALTGTQTQGDIGYKNIENNPVGLRLPLIMSGADTSAFVGILAMGFILLLPEAVNMTKKAVGASGGIFDEFKDKAVANFQKGWTGNQYVPGAKKVAPGLATGAIVGGGGAIIGGGALGLREANRMADERGVTGVPRRFMQATGLLGGTASGILASPTTATLGAVVGAGGTIATDRYDVLKDKTTKFLKGDSLASRAAATVVTDVAGYPLDRSHQNQPVQPEIKSPPNAQQEPRTATNERFDASTPTNPNPNGR